MHLGSAGRSAPGEEGPASADEEGPDPRTTRRRKRRLSSKSRLILALPLLTSCLGVSGVLLAAGTCGSEQANRQAPPLPDPFDPLPFAHRGCCRVTTGSRFPRRRWVPARAAARRHPRGRRSAHMGHRAPRAGVLAVVFGERAEAIEAEACQILGVSSCETGFATRAASHPSSFALLQAPAQGADLLADVRDMNTYTIWVYYPRLNADTLFAASTASSSRSSPRSRRLILETKTALEGASGRQAVELGKQYEGLLFGSSS